MYLADPEEPGKAHNGDYFYKLYISRDDGESFELRSVIPFESTFECFYGTMCFSEENSLMVYIYDQQDEHRLKLITSDDGGKTWNSEQKVFFDKKIRNPQVVLCNGTYFMHGRGGIPKEVYGAFILYASNDGINWGEGIYLRHINAGIGAYSNNQIVHMPDDKKRIMLQAFHAYEECKTNIIMFFIEFE